MPPVLSQKDLKAFRKSSHGDILTVRLINLSDDDCGEVSGVVSDSTIEEGVRFIFSNRDGYDLQLSDGRLRISRLESGKYRNSAEGEQEEIEEDMDEFEYWGRSVERRSGGVLWYLKEYFYFCSAR